MTPSRSFDMTAASAIFPWRSYLPYGLIVLLLAALPESGWLEARFGDSAEIAWDLFCAVIAFAGLALRTAALTTVPAGAHPHVDRLATTGVYSVVRHPLHLGSLVVLLALALSAKVWWAVLLTLAVGGFFYSRRVTDEDAFLAARYGSAFEAWRAATPAFVPDLGLWRPAETPFSLRAALRRDYHDVYQVVAALTLLEVGTDCLGDGETLSTVLANDVHWVWFFALASIFWAGLRLADRPPPLRARLWLLCIAAFLSLESLDRFVVLIWSLFAGLSFTRELLAAVPLGAFADLSTGLLLGAPFLFGLYAAPKLLRRTGFALAAHAALFVMLFVLVFSEAAELLFWNEFDSRFNSIAVSYLMFPREVIGNIRESFNLAQILPLVFGVALAFYLLLRRALVRALGADITPRERRRGLTVSVAALALGLTGLLLDPTDIFVDRTVNEATKNGLHSFLRAALTNDQKYDGVYLGMPETEALPLVRSMVTQDNTRFLRPEGERSLLRHVDNGTRPRKLNVVMVLDESFGSTYVDGLDNTRDESISPRLTRLAQDGLLFTNIYSTGNRTVRALEAVFTSFPPIPGVSTARRSGSEGMNSLPFLLKQHGYQTAFLYGGRAAFDNMGHFWSTVGFDRVWEQSDIAEADFTTIWGAADEYLYAEALKRMDTLASEGKPAFLSLLTVSNHRPYTYPAGRIDKDPARKRRESAATYADWAFGEFVDKARGHAWFRDTVFVFMGDHGPRVYGAAQVPIPGYRVPLLFYAPGHIAPERNPVLGSNMDVAPTLMGLLGLSYDSPFFGIDLRRVKADEGRVVMEHNFSVALGDGTHAAMILPGRGTRGYAMTPGPYELEPQAAPDPQALKRTVALIQTAHRMFYGRQYHDLGSPPALP